MGPGINEKNLREAINDINLLLKEKYHMFQMPADTMPNGEEKRRKMQENLKAAITEIFVWDSFEGF